MRPRPDAAENLQDAVFDVQAYFASMRPRPDAAENSTGGHVLFQRSSGFNEAAARCRGKLSVLPQRERGEGLRYASMRPRPDAAENARRRRASRR